MQAGDFYICSHAKHGDANYNNKEDCDWIIEAPAGKEPFFKKLLEETVHHSKLLLCCAYVTRR